MKNGSIKRLSLTSSYTFYLQTCKSYITKSTFYIIRTFLIPIVPQLRLHVQLRLNLLRNNSPLRPDKATASQFSHLALLNPPGLHRSILFCGGRPDLYGSMLSTVSWFRSFHQKILLKRRFDPLDLEKLLKSRKTMKIQFLYKNF